MNSYISGEKNTMEKLPYISEKQFLVPLYAYGKTVCSVIDLFNKVQLRLLRLYDGMYVQYMYLKCKQSAEIYGQKCLTFEDFLVTTHH